MSNKTVHRDKTSNFTELLQKDNAVTVHQRHLHVLATDVYKVKIGLAPQLVKELFKHFVSTIVHNFITNTLYYYVNDKDKKSFLLLFWRSFLTLLLL